MVCRAAKGDWQERNGQVFVNRMVLMNRLTVHLEEKVIALNQHFEKASDAVHARVLQEVQCGMDILDQEQRNVNTIQDPPSM